MDLRKIKQALRRILGNWCYDYCKGIYLEAVFLKYIRFYLARWFLPDSGYSEEYYLKTINYNQFCYPIFARAVYAKYRPSKVIDVGCGAGGIGLHFLQLGCAQYIGYDYSQAALKLASRVLTRAEFCDLLNENVNLDKGDLGICLEVLEHLPRKQAPTVVSRLCKIAPVLIVSAASPRQGGYLHVNEQKQEYWIGLFEMFGFAYSKEDVRDLLDEFGQEMIKDYSENLMVFRRKEKFPDSNGSHIHGLTGLEK